MLKYKITFSKLFFLVYHHYHNYNHNYYSSSELFHLPKPMTLICNIYETRGGWGRKGAGKNGDIGLLPPLRHMCFLPHYLFPSA